jgi:hypothetical protein
MKYFFSFISIFLLASCASTQGNRQPAQANPLDQTAMQVMFTSNAQKPAAEIRFWTPGDNPYEKRYFVCVDNSGQKYSVLRGDQLYYQRHRYVTMYTQQNCRLLDQPDLLQEVSDRPQ